jgi:hypothetical protein
VRNAPTPFFAKLFILLTLYYAVGILMSSPSQDYEWLGRLLMYLGIAGGVLVLGYYLVTQLITGGGQAFLNAYQTALAQYVSKMNGYGKQNNGVLNQAEQDSKDFEEKQIESLAGNAASAFNSVWGWLGTFVVATTLAALAYGVFKNPQVVAKWTGIFNNPSTQPKSPKASCIMIDLATVDELNAEGLTVQASNFLASLQSAWATVDAPYMQQQITALQSQVNAGLLSGVELDLANYFIEAYTFDLAMIPTAFSLPLAP